MAFYSNTTSVDVATSLRTTYTTPLLAQVATGNTIQAAHMTMLKNFTNAILVHTHTLTDYSQIHEFGNTNSTVSTIDTVATVGSANVGAVYTAGNPIYASEYTEIRQGVEALRVHSHAWDDLTA
jgi:hypothetical protein